MLHKECNSMEFKLKKERVKRQTITNNLNEHFEWSPTIPNRNLTQIFKCIMVSNLIIHFIQNQPFWKPKQNHQTISVQKFSLANTHSIRMYISIRVCRIEKLHRKIKTHSIQKKSRRKGEDQMNDGMKYTLTSVRICVWCFNKFLSFVGTITYPGFPYRTVLTWRVLFCVFMVH